MWCVHLWMVLGLGAVPASMFLFDAWLCRDKFTKIFNFDVGACASSQRTLLTLVLPMFVATSFTLYCLGVRDAAAVKAKAAQKAVRTNDKNVGQDEKGGNVDKGRAPQQMAKMERAEKSEKANEKLKPVQPLSKIAGNVTTGTISGRIPFRRMASEPGNGIDAECAAKASAAVVQIAGKSAASRTGRTSGTSSAVPCRVTELPAKAQKGDFETAESADAATATAAAAKKKKKKKKEEEEKEEKKKDSALGWLLCRCAMLIIALCIVVIHVSASRAALANDQTRARMPLLLPGCVCLTSVILLAILEWNSLSTQSTKS